MTMTYHYDAVSTRFTGKERDSESGLDNFGARYNSSNLGRFMSPGWSASPEAVSYAKFDDPQSLNLYSYARNNPITLTDPDGHCWRWAEKICNGFNYGRWVDNDHLEAALQKDADKAREELTRLGVQHDGKSPGEYLNGKSNQEVVDLYKDFTVDVMVGKVGTAAMLGAGGAQFTSKTLWHADGARIDVENPNPGSRPGRLHYQDGSGKYLYDPIKESFEGLSKTKCDQLLNNPAVQAAIEKGLRYLGESQ